MKVDSYGMSKNLVSCIVKCAVTFRSCSWSPCKMHPKSSHWKLRTCGLPLLSPKKWYGGSKAITVKQFQTSNWNKYSPDKDVSSSFKINSGCSASTLLTRVKWVKLYKTMGHMIAEANSWNTIWCTQNLLQFFFSLLKHCASIYFKSWISISPIKKPKHDKTLKI